MIDAVLTRNTYRCSVCSQVHQPDPERSEPVLRITNVFPDFPEDSGLVDLLVCPSCLVKAERAVKAALAAGLSAELAFFRSRLPSETRS